LGSNDDDLTDITELPDFDEVEDDNSFASLDDLAKDIGIEVEEINSPPDLPTPPSIDDLDNNDFQENDFGSDSNLDQNDDDSTDPNINFSNDSFESDFQENDFVAESEETDIQSESEEVDFGSESDEIDFGSETEEVDFGSETEEVDFGSDSGDEEANFESKPEEADFGSESGEEEVDFGSEPEESDFGSDPIVTEVQNETIEVTPQMEPKELPKNPQSNFTPESELSVPQEEKPKPKTPIEHIEKTHSSPPEQFEEFKNFANTMTFSNFSSEGNPPFSIILKNLAYVEDIEEISELLSELKVIEADSLDSTKEMLTRGQLLIPRLSEYAAIYLCHKLRRFDVEILMGLTEEISPPKSYESNDRGLSSKRTILSNKKHHFQFNEVSNIEDVMVTTLPKLTDHNIVKYIGVVTEHRNLTQDEISNNAIEDELLEQISESQQEEVYLNKIKRENTLAGQSQNKFNYYDFYQNTNTNQEVFSIDRIYQDLVSKLKVKAKASNANGVVGISFSISPISTDEYLKTGQQYQVLCTGNLVWIERA